MLRGDNGVQKLAFGAGIACEITAVPLLASAEPIRSEKLS
jgi:hypothetical protein